MKTYQLTSQQNNISITSDFCQPKIMTRLESVRKLIEFNKEQLN